MSMCIFKLPVIFEFHFSTPMKKNVITKKAVQKSMVIFRKSCHANTIIIKECILLIFLKYINLDSKYLKKYFKIITTAWF